MQSVGLCLIASFAIVLGKKRAPEPEPEPPSSMLPIVIAVACCWVVPFLLMQYVKNSIPANAKVGINGFGRIGRLVACVSRPRTVAVSLANPKASRRKSHLSPPDL